MKITYSLTITGSLPADARGSGGQEISKYVYKREVFKWLGAAKCKGTL